MLVPTSRAFLWRTAPDGRREIGWRAWVLIWVAPAMFVGTAAMMLAYESYRHLASVPAIGEVVRVYEWQGETMFDHGVTNYGPVFRYAWTDGTETEASTGMSDPNWNFEIGSTHPIRYFPRKKGNIVLPGLANFLAGLVVGAIGVVLTVPALLGTFRLCRWQRVKS